MRNYRNRTTILENANAKPQQTVSQTGFQNRGWALRDQGLSAQPLQTSLSAQGIRVERSNQVLASMKFHLFTTSFRDRSLIKDFSRETSKNKLIDPSKKDEKGMISTS